LNIALAELQMACVSDHGDGDRNSRKLIHCVKLCILSPSIRRNNWYPKICLLNYYLITAQSTIQLYHEMNWGYP